MRQIPQFIDIAGLAKPEMSNQEWPVFAGSVAQGTLADGAFVEIGVYRAHSTRCVLQVLDRLGSARRVVSIDPFPDAAGAHAQAAREAGGACSAEFVLGMSHVWAREFAEPVAWVLIDGCHCHECVSDDLRGWIPKLSPWGIAVLHDTRAEQHAPTHNDCWRTGMPRRRLIEVARAVRESKELSALTLVDMVESNTKYGIRVYRKVP